MAAPRGRDARTAAINDVIDQVGLTVPNAVPDFANPEQMNRYTWYQTLNWSKPYPEDSRIYAPNGVPGAYIPSSESDG